ncbi:MAG: DUF4358 domain-containing protein [Oscillospiraceae bacterium]|nr:DUF4358 domain-containing protein [Oscillospiraceae bacterium]
MKRVGLLLLAACMITGIFSGCVQEAKPAVYDLEALSSQLEQSGAFSDILSPVSKDIAKSFYGFEDADVTECVVLCSTGATTEEIALFKCATEEAATKLKASADKRVQTQKETYESYAPAEPPKLDDAIVTQNGLYVFYIVSADYTKAQAVIDTQNK